MSRLHNILKGAALAAATVAMFTGLSKTALAYNNLVSNSSVETVSATAQPTDWQTSSWGSLATKFSYKAAGQASSHSVRVDVSNYQSGDAKWYFKPVQTTPLRQYIYSDYYKSSAATSLVVAFTRADGSVIYQWLADVPASSTWKKTTQFIVTPADTTQTTVYHLIMGNGFVQTDSFVFKQAEDVAVANGVANNSLEVASEADANLPARWQKAKWGSNTATFTYAKAVGYQSTRSAKITMTNYVDGDAKWYFDPAQVTAGTNYVFSDYYRSNVATQAVAMLTDTNGVTSYIYLGSIPASTSWKRASYSVVMPSGTKTATILHTISANGYLQTDNYSFLPAAQTTITNGVPNSSLEQASDIDVSLPQAWRTAGWGTNTPKYTYQTTGHTGSRSVKVELSSYTDGDAKWMYGEQPVTPGSNNRFSAFYQATTTGHAVVMFTHTNGSVSYFGMHNAEATPNWTLYTDTFIAPATAQTATIFFYISAVGSFTSDDYSLAPYTYTGFDKPRLSLTFDDGWEENVTTVLPRLNAFGYKSTQYYATQHITETNDTSGLEAFAAAGHEIGSHTITHPNLGTISLASVIYELTESQRVLETALGSSVPNFASPYGGYNTQVVSEIAKLYRSHRTVDEGYNSKDNFDIYRLKVQNVLIGTSPAQVAEWVARAQQDKTWLILVYHKVGTTSLGAYDSYSSDFDQHLASIQAANIPVQTVNQALNEILPQL